MATKNHFFNSHKPSSKNIVWWGVFSILLLMLPLVLLSLYQLSHINRQIETTIHISNQKIRLIQQMHHAVNSRSILLLKTLNSKDVFEMEETRVRMEELAEQFIKARMQLIQFQLTEQENRLLKEQGQISKLRLAAQRQVAEFMVEEKLEEATYLLKAQVLSNQDNIHQLLDELITVHQEQSEQQLTEFQNIYNKSFSTLILASIFSLGLAILVGHIISRQVAKTENNYQLLNRLLHRAVQHTKADSRAKSAFLANMSHELRTPLHGILSYAKLGQKQIDILSSEKAHRYFSNIQLSGERLLNLLNDLLDLSKLEAGHIHLDKSENNIVYLLNSCKNEVADKLQELELELKIEALQQELDHPIIAHCDSSKIMQVVGNLLSNAIKFSPRQGNIFVRYGYEQSLSGVRHVSVQVIDQGPGIEGIDKIKIFTKFAQSAQSQTGTNYGSTGLGLAICRQIIIAHGGRIWAENNKDGRGAAFTFELPEVG